MPVGNYLRPYLEMTDLEPIPGSAHKVWIGSQSSAGIYEEPSATDALMVVARTSANSPRARLDNEEFRGTRAPGSKIPGVYPETPFTAEIYLQPPGSLTVTAVLDSTDNPMQGDRPFREVFGRCKIVNTHALVAVGSVVTATRDSTVITVPNSALYAVGDLCALRTAAANALTSGPANNEVRRITGIDIGGANRLTFEPGFSQKPIATTDKIQGVRQYMTTKGWRNRMSARVLEGAVGKQIADVKANNASLSLTSEDAIKLSLELMGLDVKTAGIDQVTGTASADTLASTDPITVDVANASKYEVGSYVDLIVTDPDPTSPTYDTLISTETAALVTARNTSASPNTLTLTRGGGVVATATDLTARTTGTEEAAGTYDFTVKKWLKFRVDYRPWKTVDLSSLGATASEAATVSFLNAFLVLDADYGYNVDGRYAIDWGTGVFVDGTGVEMHSKAFGSQSMVQVAIADQGSAASAHDELFTGAFSLTAVEEVQIHPHDPGTTEVGITPNVGQSFELRYGSYRMGVTGINWTMSNNAEVTREMRANLRPQGIIPGKNRTHELTLELYQKEDAAAFFDFEREATLKPLGFQMNGDALVAGEIFGAEFPLARVAGVELGGDDTKATVTLQIEVEGTNDDSGTECIAYIA